MSFKIELNVGDRFWAERISGKLSMAITHQLYEVTRVNGSSVYGVVIVKAMRSGDYIEERLSNEVRFSLRTYESKKSFFGTDRILFNEDGTLYEDENY